MEESSSHVDSYRSAFDTDGASCRYGQKKSRFAADLCQQDSNALDNQDVQLAEQLS
jgi:hypothetical protein